MKLEVGMHIRTKDGIIDKVIIDYNGHCANPNCKHKHISCAKNYYDEDNVVKASYNIIDILEVGDYVNGCYIQEIKSLKDNVMVCMLDSDYEFVSTITNKEIKTIVTHEQFESMTYNVGE